MDDFLAAVPPVAAVVASVVGILVAVDQLTQRARMRRVAEWAKQLAEEEKEPGRVAVLASVRAWATGHALATVLVPARLFLEATIWCIAVPGLIIGTSGTISVGTWALVGFAALWPVLRRAIRLYLERYRIAAEYFRGGSVAPPRLTLLYRMEGGTRAEFLWSAILAAAITAGSLGARTILRDEGEVGVWLILLGFGLGGLGAALVRRVTPPLLHDRSEPEA